MSSRQVLASLTNWCLVVSSFIGSRVRWRLIAQLWRCRQARSHCRFRSETQSCISSGSALTSAARGSHSAAAICGASFANGRFRSPRLQRAIGNELELSKHLCCVGIATARIQFDRLLQKNNKVAARRSFQSSVPFQRPFKRPLGKVTSHQPVNQQPQRKHILTKRWSPHGLIRRHVTDGS